jgi:hypothetical protein
MYSTKKYDKQNTKQRKKILKKSRKKIPLLLELLQVPPPTQESGERELIDKAKYQGTTTSNKVVKQKWGEPKRYLKKANSNNEQLAINKAEHQGAMAGR